MFFVKFLHCEIISYVLIYAYCRWYSKMPPKDLCKLVYIGQSPCICYVLFLNTRDVPYACMKVAMNVLLVSMLFDMRIFS